MEDKKNPHNPPKIPNTYTEEKQKGGNRDDRGTGPRDRKKPE